MLAEEKQERFHILLADDGSEHARAALALLEDLPLPAGNPVTVLRVFAATQAGDLSALEQALEQTCARLRLKGWQAHAELLLGSPAEKVVEYAGEQRPDLIVVGAKGLRATFGILLGGVAQQVVEYACCPVLVVRAPYRPLGHALLVTDGSPTSQLAVAYLGRLPLPQSTHLKVMHVLPPPPIPIVVPNPPYGELIAGTPLPVSKQEAELRAQEEAEGQALLDRTVAELQALGRTAGGLLKRGDAATEILEYARKQKVDLVITGSRGLGRIKSWMMGSVSRKLVHYADCSVLVVRGGQAPERPG